MITLTSSQRSYLSKRAHNLKPVVMVGQKGPTGNVVKSLTECFNNHELVKVKLIDFKSEKLNVCEFLAKESNSVLVRVIGNIGIFYKEFEDPEKREFTLPE